MRIPLLATNVVLVLVQVAAARDIYVNNVAGNDQHSGTIPVALNDDAGPSRTIARALRAARKGDRIILENSGVPYRECIALSGANHSGWTGRPFEIIGNGAVLDGSFSIPDGAWQHVHRDVFRFRPPRMSHQLLFLNGVPANRITVESEAERFDQLTPLDYCFFQRQIYFQVEKDRLPHSYDLAHTGHPVGFTLYEVRDVVIADVVVQGYQLDGINAHDNAFNVRLRNVTCRGNARSGISVGGASRVAIEGCLVGNNGVAQVRTEGHSITRIRASTLLENPAPAVLKLGGQIDRDVPEEP